MKRVGSQIASGMGFVAVLCGAGCGSRATARHGASHVVSVPRFGTMSELHGDRVSAVIDVGGAPTARIGRHKPQTGF